MDTICNCAFGMDIDCIKNPDNEFYVKSDQIFNSGTNVSTAVKIPSKMSN